jgi:hypothetical protein
MKNEEYRKKNVNDECRTTNDEWRSFGGLRVKKNTWAIYRLTTKATKDGISNGECRMMNGE